MGRVDRQAIACALAAVAVPVAWLWFGLHEAYVFGAAAAALLLFGKCSPWAAAFAALPAVATVAGLPTG